MNDKRTMKPRPKPGTFDLDRVAASVATRVNPTSVRVEWDDRGDDRGAILAVPSMRPVWEGPADPGRAICEKADAIVRERRLYATRPLGTCPFCADPLSPPPDAAGLPGSGWCRRCGRYVRPAGARISTEEAAVIADVRAVNRQKVERSRGR